jgi:prolyl oligopeptidase
MVGTPPDVPPAQPADRWDWLRQEDLDALAWQGRQVAASRSLLHGVAEHGVAARLLRRWSAGQAPAPPSCFGGTWFDVVRTSDGETLVCRAEPTGEPRVLLEPARHVEGGGIDWYAPSPDGTVVAAGISAGDEQSVVHVVDVATGEAYPDRLPHASFGSVVWDGDGHGFHYTAGRAVNREEFRKRVWRHRLGAPPREGPEPATFEDGFVVISGSVDGRRLLASEREVVPRASRWKDLAGDTWHAIGAPPAEGLDGVLCGDAVVAITTLGNDRGRLVQVPLSTADMPVTWRELPLPDDAVLQELRHLRGCLLVVSALIDAQAALFVVSETTGEVRRVPLPAYASVKLGRCDASSPVVAVSCSTFTTSPALLVLDAAAARLDVVRAPVHELRDVTVERRQARSADGTSVPYFLLRPPSSPPGERVPAVVYAYGGFNLPALPAYRAEVSALLETGHAYVLANIRGGGEFGRDWWEAARFAHRGRSYDDVAAVVEDLRTAGGIDSARIGLYGASNGGLMAAAMAVRRPDLFRAVVSLVPVTDLLHGVEDAYYLHDLKIDFGDPSDPAAAAWIATYSPLQNVPEQLEAPNTLVCCGARDTRCAPWHSRVLVAAMQAANSGSAEVLLQVWDGAGHLAVPALDEQLRNTADWLGFLMRHLGAVSARTSEAAALDADLMATEHRQRYGTVVTRESGEPVLWGLDPTVTDDERLRVGLPTLKELTDELWHERLALAQDVAERGLAEGQQLSRVLRDPGALRLRERVGERDRAVWLDGSDLVFCYRGPGSAPAVLLGWVAHLPMQRADGDLWFVAVRLREAAAAAVSWFVMPGPEADLAAVVASGQVWRGPDSPRVPQPATGIRGDVTVEAFRSDALGETRDVSLYLPAPAAASRATSPLPVLFAADGWQRPDLVEPLIEAGAIPPIAVVAAASDPSGAGRAAEYLPGAERHARAVRFFGEELAGWAASRFDVATDAGSRAVFGVSNGAAFALSAAAAKGAGFGRVIAFSIGGSATAPPALPPEVAVYLCSGRLEKSFHETTSRVAAALDVPRRELVRREWVAGHDVAMWDVEVVRALTWAFGGVPAT